MEQTKRKPEPSAEKAEEGKKEDRRRLREILGVLARHNLAGGMTPEKLRSIVEDLGPTFVKPRTDYVHAAGYAAGGILP